MNSKNILNNEDAIFEIWAEIHRDKFARNEHRLHAVLLVFQGFSHRKVAELFGDSPGNVGHWVRKYKTEGIAGLIEGAQSGRRSRLNRQQLKVVADVLERTPSYYRFNGDKWNGEQLSLFIKKYFNVDLSIRQCQRLIRQFKSK